MVSDTARKGADTRTRIANFYVTNSDLQLQMYTAADWYNTYGLGIGMVEMDFEDNNPTLPMHHLQSGTDLGNTQLMTYEEFTKKVLNQ